ncbi:homeodomain family transcription factor STE12 NDAI_0C01830 [Naumovozyma dairenensis CBS 421]|uniref:Uncharacterized protein n=1 Tax=Naumovozyma dairenensis (strain ATCC 10597 / BCRC 20456 / CBS 421 / NBRC 0211 / NRRL Y-12639) TaxID=1071378 RepID=G0W7T3_NAUDC|nr:hypothetical protein NDAI_0C01830 [Naumovozyma dairenensis CBS 421]CCD23844.1 hypothetical protein NDAI_0C01830 [Naumovozyma dairenensis CBS 421]
MISGLYHVSFGIISIMLQELILLNVAFIECKNLVEKLFKREKFEEGIFSDLRNLKCGIDAILEQPKSAFLQFLFKNICLKTQKKQKVFFWFSVPHDKLFADALERDLKRETLRQKSTTRSVMEPALSFNFNLLSDKTLYEQLIEYMDSQRRQPTSTNDTISDNNNNKNDRHNNYFPPHITMEGHHPSIYKTQTQSMTSLNDIIPLPLNDHNNEPLDNGISNIPPSSVTRSNEMISQPMNIPIPHDKDENGNNKSGTSSEDINIHLFDDVDDGDDGDDDDNNNEGEQKDVATNDEGVILHNDDEAFPLDYFPISVEYPNEVVEPFIDPFQQHQQQQRQIQHGIMSPNSATTSRSQQLPLMVQPSSFNYSNQDSLPPSSVFMNDLQQPQSASYLSTLVSPTLGSLSATRPHFMTNGEYYESLQNQQPLQLNTDEVTTIDEHLNNQEQEKNSDNNSKRLPYASDQQLYQQQQMAMYQMQPYANPYYPSIPARSITNTTVQEFPNKYLEPNGISTFGSYEFSPIQENFNTGFPLPQDHSVWGFVPQQAMQPPKSATLAHNQQFLPQQSSTTASGQIPPQLSFAYRTTPTTTIMNTQIATKPTDHQEVVELSKSRKSPYTSVKILQKLGKSNISLSSPTIPTFVSMKHNGRINKPLHIKPSSYQKQLSKISRHASNLSDKRELDKDASNHEGSADDDDDDDDNDENNDANDEFHKIVGDGSTGNNF